MSVAVSIISAVLKSVVGDKLGSGLIKELAGISIDGISEKSINEITDFINKGKSKIDNILSRENMKSMGISDDIIDYVVAEVKDLFSKFEISDEILRQCRYDSMNLSAFLWNKYCESKSDYIECESEIKRSLFTIAEVLIKLLQESKTFEKDVLIQISNSVDDTNVELQKISEYLKYNFDKLDDNSKIVINILWMILVQIQKNNMQSRVATPITNENTKFKNNRKEDYIKNWNSRLFLHIDNEENPITLADAFIVPKFDYYVQIGRIKFSNKDLLTDAIEKFIEYGKTSNLLITGAPGIGKTSIISWIANKYRDNDDVIILKFRDWSIENLLHGILNAILGTLNCEREELENKVIVLDGFDEIKLLNEHKNLIRELFDNTLDFDNLKIIITSRPDYLNTFDFQNVFEILALNIYQIKEFYQIIKGIELDHNKIDCDNLDILGIPVILYMAIMANVDLTIKATRPELYNRIFAEKGGIFDKFCLEGIGYDNGMQPLRDIENVKIYLGFLQQVAFSMFEKNDLCLSKEEYDIPKLEFHGQKLKVLEFPIKPLFESNKSDIEFIHKSIYEYFVSEYIFVLLLKTIEKHKEELARDFGILFKKNVLSKEIFDFLKYKIKSSIIIKKFKYICKTFQLMLYDGMTSYTGECYKNVIRCEMRVVANMLQILHIWNLEEVCFNSLNYYIKYNSFKLNLSGMELRKANLKGAGLGGADLEKANLNKANLYGANLKGANLKRGDLRNANLKGANLRNADLSGADMRGAIVIDSDLGKAILTDIIINENQAGYLRKRYNLQGTKVYISKTQEIIGYNEYCNRKNWC